jgi:hypothetical protein
MKQWIFTRLAVGLVVPGCLAVPSSAWSAGLGQDTAPLPALVLPEPPSLAEIARLEAERRRALRGGGKSKVYSDKDLKQAGPGAPTPAPGSAAPAPSTTPVPDAPTPAGGQLESTAQGEAAWRKRMTDTREELRRNEVFAEALQTRVTALTNDFVGRDDPLLRSKVGEDRQKAIAELDRVKSEIARGKQAILDIEEDARKAGVPPGWVR